MSFLLLIDDDDDHRELFALAAQTLQLDEEVVTLKSGPLALEYLQARGERPLMILVDVKMPGMDGPTTVQRLRELDSLELVPVVMISTSDALADLKAARRAGANSYVLKPLGARSWLDTLSQLVSYWSSCDAHWRAHSSGL